MKRIITSIAVAGGLLAAGAAHAGAPTDVIQRHMAAGGDLDKLMADYADDAVVLQQGKALVGKDEIRAFYAQMFAPKANAPANAPADAPAGTPQAPSNPFRGIRVIHVSEQANVGILDWEMGPMKATEEFVLRPDGKIAVQAVFMTAPMQMGGK